MHEHLETSLPSAIRATLENRSTGATGKIPLGHKNTGECEETDGGRARATGFWLLYGRGLRCACQMRILHEGVTDHVADAHLRIFHAAIMFGIDHDHLLRELRQPAPLRAD